MWYRKPSNAEMIETVCEVVFMHSHQSLSQDKIIQKLPKVDSYTVLDALCAARDEDLIFCANGRWGVRPKYLKRRSGK